MDVAMDGATAVATDSEGDDDVGVGDSGGVKVLVSVSSSCSLFFSRNSLKLSVTVLGTVTLFRSSTFFVPEFDCPSKFEIDEEFLRLKDMGVDGFAGSESW